MEHFLVIDQGTHASRCMIFNASGEMLAQTQRALSVYRQENGFIEQNAEEILDSVNFCIDKLREHSAFKQITAAALVTQRSTIVGWNKRSGKALSAAISWQDTRAAHLLEPLIKDTAEIQQITGLVLSAHYGASKIKWLIQNDELCRQAYKTNDIIIAPLASYLIKHLTTTASAVIDHVNASRTQLFDINKLSWSSSMLNKFELSESCLPEVRPCLCNYGMLRNHSIPLKLVNGDQNAALFANGMISKHTILVNIGTGAFALKMTKQLEHKPGLLNGLAVSQVNKNIYLQEGTVNGAGAALASLYSEISEQVLFEKLPGWLNSINDAPIYINTISGLGSPWWDNTVHSHYLNAEAKDIELPLRAVAIIESIVFLLQNNIERLADASTQQIHISGGLARLDGLCQKLADISGLEILRFDNNEASASGAASLLAKADSWHIHKPTRCFVPANQPLLNKRYQIFTQQLNLLTHHINNSVLLQ